MIPSFRVLLPRCWHSPLVSKSVAAHADVSRYCQPWSSGLSSTRRGYGNLPPKPYARLRPSPQTTETNREQAATAAAHHVSKDVLLFSYNKPGLFVAMKCFGVVALLACTYMAETCYSTLRDVGRASERHAKTHPRLPSAIPDSLHWWERINFGQDVVRGGLALILIAAGSLVSAYCTILLPSRTVRALVLLRGGQNLGVSTYASFGSGKYMVVPRQEVVPMTSRDMPAVGRPSTSDVPLKIRGRLFYYMLNSRGSIHNGELYDHLFSTRVW